MSSFRAQGSGGGGLSVSTSASPASIVLGSAVTFTASAAGGNSSNYSYAWLFPDGTGATGASVSWAPEKAGTFIATVTVTDGSQNTGTGGATVTVTEGAVNNAPYYTLSLPSGASNSINLPQNGSVQAYVVLNGVNSYALVPALTAGATPAGVTVSFDNGGMETYGTVIATISASATAPLGPFTLKILGNDGSPLPQASLTLSVTVTPPLPLSVTTSVIYSNIDPVAHTGTTATLVAYPAGGMGPYSYQWSGGGGTWSGNRMTMGAPSAAVTGTLTVTDSSSPARQTVSVVQTIPVSPVVTEDALYAAVLNRIWAVENFGNGLDAKGTGGSYFHNLILSQANLQQPILTPAQYASLVTLAMNYRAEQTNDAISYRTIKGGLKGAQPQSVPSVQASLLALTANQLARTTRYLTQVQAQTGLGNPAAPTAFDTYAWSNYAPSVECEGGGGGSGGDSAQIYLDNYLGQDPGTLEMEATADAWIAGGFEGGYDGTQVEMTLSLYDSSGNGHVDEAQPVEYGPGGATAWVIWTPRYPGDPYTSYAWAGATAYDAEDDTENVYADSFVTLNTLSACIPIPSISGAIMVDGVPTNGFVLPASGTKTGTLTIGGECMAGVTGISFPGLSGLTATVTQTTGCFGHGELFVKFHRGGGDGVFAGEQFGWARGRLFAGGGGSEFAVYHEHFAESVGSRDDGSVHDLWRWFWGQPVAFD